MFIKQIGLHEALRLAAEGKEVKVLVQAGQRDDWASIEPNTLENLLANVLFFRDEPAMEESEFLGLIPESGENPSPSLDLLEQIKKLPPAPVGKPASVWVPVKNGSR